MTNLQDEQLSGAYDLPPFDGIGRDYIIASTPRSGSHLLCFHLIECGGFGVPLEYLNPDNLPRWQARLGTTDADTTIEALRSIRTSPNGVFGMKLHYSHARRLGGIAGLRRLTRELRIVHIRRVDLLGQAISYARAMQTGVWISGQPPTGEPHYDFGLIERMLQLLIRDEAEWQLLMAKSGFPSMEVRFEEVVDDPIPVVSEVARFLDVDADVSSVAVQHPIAPQQRDHADAWRERFTAEADNSAMFTRLHGVANRIDRRVRSFQARR